QSKTMSERGVEVAAGRGEGVAGGYDVRALEPAEVDGLLQGDVEQQTTGLHNHAEVPPRRDPGPQRAPGIGDGPQRAQSGVVLDGVERTLVVRAAEEEVD